MERDPNQARDVVRDPQTQSTRTLNWNVIHRICFRFLFSYIALYLLLHWFISHTEMLADFGLLPSVGLITKMYAKSWAPVVIWMGKHILHVQKRIKYFSGGNSDGIYSFVEIFCFAAFASVAAFGWTIVNRKRADYQRLYEWLSICLRYALAFTLLSYGILKVIPTQFFGLPNLVELVSPYGDFSRFSVLWNFMGYSASYTIFTGLVEVSAGALLLFRRTATLGALAAAAALVNVAVLDFSYGVPEKLDVLHLILMSLIILAPEFGRLADFFIFNRPTISSSIGNLDVSGRMRFVKAAAKIGVVGFMIVTTCRMPYKIRESYSPHSPIYGIYEVQEFTLNGQLLTPLATDTVRWKKVVFQSESETYVESMNDSWNFYDTKYNKSSKELTVTGEDEKTRSLITYSEPDSEHLILSGPTKIGSISVKLNRVDEMKLPLMKSKFRWINGEP
jgi:uncharacterized membrane protein YphA (DoxX/SURF4 family)